MDYHRPTVGYLSDLLQHEGQRILQVSLKGGQPPGADSTVNRSVIRAQRDLHYLRGLETLLGLWGRDQGWNGGTNSKDTRLWWVDDGSKVTDAKHAQVRDRERSTLLGCDVS